MYVGYNKMIQKVFCSESYTKKAVGVDRFFTFIYSEVIALKMLCLFSCLGGKHKVQAKQFAIFHTQCYY